MLIKRDWTDDVYAFCCAQAMDEHGVRIVAVHTAPGGLISVWGQADGPIDCDAIDARTDELIGS